MEKSLLFTVLSVTLLASILSISTNMNTSVYAEEIQTSTENEAEIETEIEQENKCKKDSECENENEINNQLTITNITQSQQQEEPQTKLNVVKTLECQNEGNPRECIDIGQGDFAIAVTGNNPNPSEFPGSQEGRFVTLGSGDYTVSETTNILFPPLTEWSASFSGDCTKSGEFAGEGTIDEGETQTCTIHNTVNFIAD